jgi:hypothetical protein
MARPPASTERRLPTCPSGAPIALHAAPPRSRAREAATRAARLGDTPFRSGKAACTARSTRRARGCLRRSGAASAPGTRCVRGRCCRRTGKAGAARRLRLRRDKYGIQPSRRRPPSLSSPTVASRAVGRRWAGRTQESAREIAPSPLSFETNPLLGAAASPRLGIGSGAAAGASASQELSSGGGMERGWRWRGKAFVFRGLKPVFACDTSSARGVSANPMPATTTTTRGREVLRRTMEREKR